MTTPSAPQRVPLRLIAEKAGVSRMTVSLALRDHLTIAATTRKRIQRIAQSLGYRPDPVVSEALSTLRRSAYRRNNPILAYITHGPRPDTWMDSFTQRQYYKGAVDRANEMGFEVQMFTRLLGGVSDRRLSQILYNRGIRGLIIAPMPYSRAGERIDFEWQNFAPVFQGYSVHRPELHRAVANHFQIAYDLYVKLAALGYERIGLAVPLEQDRRTHTKWRGGWLGAQDELGHSRLPAYLPEKWSRESFLRWFELARPDVVIGIGDPVIPWIESTGLRVPRDVGYASLDLTDETSAAKVSGMNQFSEAVGRAVVDLTVATVHRGEWGVPEHPKIIQINGAWVAGRTTRSLLRSKSRRTVSTPPAA